MFLSLDEHHVGIHLRDMTFFVTGNERERFSDQSMNFHVNRALEANLVALETLAQTLVEFGIVGLPQLVADFDALIIYVAVAEAEPGFRAARSDLINTSAFLVLIRRARIEHHAVTRLQWANEFERHGFISHVCDLAEEHTTFFSEARVNELLIVVPAEPTGEQAARKRHLHVIPGRINRRTFQR